MSVESEEKWWEEIIETRHYSRIASKSRHSKICSHNFLAKHLYRIGIRVLLNSSLWHQGIVMDGPHLFICPILDSSDNIVKKYWDAKKEWSDTNFGASETDQTKLTESIQTKLTKPNWPNRPKPNWLNTPKPNRPAQPRPDQIKSTNRLSNY